MAHKKVAKIIATAIVVNNLSSSVVLGKELNLIENNKDNSVINENINESKVYNNIFRIEKTVGNAEEFLKIINQGNLEEIKLSKDINLKEIESKGLNIEGSNIVIDGNFNSIYIPNSTENIKKNFFKLQGDGVVLKNLNIVFEGEGKEKGESLITILGDDIRLENISIKSDFKRAINILEGRNAKLENINIINKEESSTGIRVDNGSVDLNNLYVENKSGLGLDILGKYAKVNLEGDIKINSPIEVRGLFRDGALLNCNNNQLINKKNVFGYTYYRVAKETELVRNKDEFLEAINNDLVKKIKLMNNIDLRGNEEDYYKVFEKEVKIDKNNYHITM